MRTDKLVSGRLTIDRIRVRVHRRVTWRLWWREHGGEVVAVVIGAAVMTAIAVNIR